MLKSLYFKLAVVLLGLFCLTGLFFIALTVLSTDMYQSEVNQKLNLKLADNIVAEKILMEDNRINDTALEEIFHMLMVINPSIELYLLDPQGNILTYSAPPEKVKVAKVDMAPIHDWFSEKRHLPLMGEDPRHIGRKKAITVARIPKEGALEGYLYIILGGESYDNVMEKLKGSYILQVSFWAILAVIAFAVTAGFLVFAFLTRRLKKLAQAMDDFKENKSIEYLHQKKVSQQGLSDEIDRLDNAFVRMAEHIQNQMQEIHRSDELRRELIANISHDLRTPIATLQGYVETLLLKEQKLAPEQKKEYLVTAHTHCKRLGELVENLFELAKLDAGETRPNYEPFSITDLTQDVVQKFQLVAEKKGVQIDVDLEENLAFVNADISLIERVFENLIENALQYTSEGDRLSLHLSSDGTDVSIEVEDSGQGIPESQLPHIFNRFYRVDKSRKNQSGHSGLGLAITKRILNLHDRDISVESTLGSGTTFSFKLPAC